MVNILFWLFVLAFDLLLPVVMIFFGREFMKNPPKEINPGYGYRTAMSSKNQDTWDFAQRKMGEVWHKWGKILLIPSALPLLLVLGRDLATVGTVGAAICLWQLIPMLGSAAVVEWALKKNFDKHGKRKTETD